MLAIPKLNKLKKNKIKEGTLFNNKFKNKNNINELTEFRKIHRLGNSINISNNERHIFNSLKLDVNHKSKNRNNKKINYNNNKYKNNNDQDLLLKKEKIKVTINSIKAKSKNKLKFRKINSIINPNINKLHLIEDSKTSFISHSNLNNERNLNKRNSKILKSIKRTFESSIKNKLQKNRNNSYKNYFNKLNEKKSKVIKNRNDLMKNNKKLNTNNEKEKDYCLNKNLIYYRDQFKQILNCLDINNLNTFKSCDNSSINKKKYIKKCRLTKKKYIKSSDSLKSLTKEIIKNSNLKLIKNNDLNNENDITLLSPKCNQVSNTYKKKLIQRRFIKIEKNYLDNNTFKADNHKILENSKNNNIIDSNLILFNSINYISPKNESNSNNSSIFTSMHAKLINENENIKPNCFSSNKIRQRINNKNLSKDETKYQTDHNFISYNNNSTSHSNSFNIQRKKNIIINQKLAATFKFELKLKNIVTKINFKNENNNESKKIKKIKNIILCEFDKDGNAKYKVKELKKCIEKIIMEKEDSKKKNQSIVASPKNHKKEKYSLYVKKNQGTILRRSKNISKFELILK